MSDKPGNEVANKSILLNELVNRMGCPLENPFSTLSFMALPVVPEIKITNKGLFDVDENKFMDLIIKEE